MKTGLTVVKDLTKQLALALVGIPQQDVLVGIPAEKTDRKEPDTEITNAAIGYISEYGAPEANIPARKWLEPGIRAAQNKVISYMKQAAQYGLVGDNAGVERALHSAGMAAVNTTKARINAGIPPPLKASTIAGRLSRGRKGTIPLVDTGQFRNSVTYVLRDKKK